MIWFLAAVVYLFILFSLLVLNHAAAVGARKYDEAAWFEHEFEGIVSGMGKVGS